MLKVCLSGFPHSEISGSSDICSSPKLIAAYRVFHRLLVPRHPPCALISLTVCFLHCGYSPVYSVTPLAALFRLLLPRRSWNPAISTASVFLKLFVCFFRHGFRRNASDVLNISILDIVFNMWFSRYIVTEFYQSSVGLINSNPLITGKNQLYGTALPCWSRLTHLFHLHGITGFAFISTH